MTDQYALLDEDANPPAVDLGRVVANDVPVRSAATAHLALHLPDGEPRTVTREVRPFGGNADQAYVVLRFPERTVDELAAATARFWVTDCRRLGVVPPVAVGCAERVVREKVGR